MASFNHTRYDGPNNPCPLCQEELDSYYDRQHRRLKIAALVAAMAAGVLLMVARLALS